MAAKEMLERLLSPVEVRAKVPAAPEAVFAVLSDLEEPPEWLTGAQPVASDPPKRLELELNNGPIKGAVEFELERTAEGTLVTFRECLTGALGAVMPAVRGPIFLRNKASLDKLRKRFEPLVVRL
jgi:hypothetical protein